MYRGIFKRAGCVLLIAVLCFGLAAPAFASSSGWYDDFIDDLLQPSVSAPGSVSSAVSDILYFSTLQTSVNGDAQMLLTVQGSTPPADVSGLLQSGYQNYFSNYFTSNFSTTSSDRYVYVTLTDLQEFIRKLDNVPVTLTYLPSTGVYVPVLSHTAISARPGSRGYSADKVKFWHSLSTAEGGSNFVEGAALKALPYVGDYILVAPAPDREPSFFPSGDRTSSSATTNHNYYTDSSSVDNSVNDNSVTTNTTIYEGGETYNTSTFDYSNGTWYDNVSGTVNDIENLYYNPSTNTYTINNTYNITYEYNYTYYYNLGSSENLVQDYKFYYELPDGRSSSDLTADEIAGLSLEFDVVNYAQDRTDENTKILVPFDGSWEDVAYNGPKLAWLGGASVSYKESASFNGALYIPGSASSSFGFPGSFPKSTFLRNGMTVQFRYYVDALSGSSQTTPDLSVFVTHDYKSNTGRVVSIYNGNIGYDLDAGNVLRVSNHSTMSALATGVWNDITISVVPVNTSGSFRLCVYVNGVLVGSPTFTSSNTLSESPYPTFFFNTQNGGLAARSSSTYYDYPDGFVLTSGNYEMPYQMIDNLRVVDFALYDGSSNSNFTPTPVPFDTNLVYVLPDTANLKDNTIAVQSGVPVSGYRIGGVRPTFPDEGMVWMPLENDKVADCQIYNGSYWESVGCRVWTGERWVPAWAFNVITLSDLWDMYGGEDSDNYTEITPGSFYQWFQQQFLELKTTITNGFNGILEALGVEVEGEEDITEPDVDGNADFTLLQLVDRILAGITKVPAEVLSKALGSISETVGGFVTGVTNFFGGVEDMGEQSQPFFESMDGVLGNASQLVHDTWEAVPEDAQNVLSTCFMLAVFGSCIVIFLG